MTHPLGLLGIEDKLTPVKKLSQKNFYFLCFQDMLPRLRRLIGLQYKRSVDDEIHFSKLLSYENAHEQAICFSWLTWLSRNKSVQKSRFSRIVKNSREFSLLDLDLEAFWFHFSLLEKEWKHFFSLCTSRKRVKAFCFHFSLLDL